VCLSVGDDISGATRAIFTNFLCMLPMAVHALSSSGTVTESQGEGAVLGIFLPVDNGIRCKRDHSISAGKGVMGVHSVGEVGSAIALSQIEKNASSYMWRIFNHIRLTQNSDEVAWCTRNSTTLVTHLFKARVVFMTTNFTHS